MRIRLTLAALASLSLLAAPVPASAAPAGHDDGDVVAEQVNADGTINVTIWSPAPGVSAKELYGQLKARNIAGLRDPAQSRRGARAEPVDCNIQGAYAWARLCGTQRYHWSGSHPVIYFVDHSSGAWPVYEAAVQWNKSTALDVGYRAPLVVCPSGGFCAYVRSGSYTDKCSSSTSWVGCTSLGLNSATRLIESATIRLNDRFSSTYAANQIVTCHELGHALGLDHNLYTTSCMYWQRTSNGSRFPHTGDYLMLESVY